MITYYYVFETEQLADDFPSKEVIATVSNHECSGICIPGHTTRASQHPVVKYGSNWRPTASSSMTKPTRYPSPGCVWETLEIYKLHQGTKMLRPNIWEVVHMRLKYVLRCLKIYISDILKYLNSLISELEIWFLREFGYI